MAQVLVTRATARSLYHTPSSMLDPANPASSPLYYPISVCIATGCPYVVSFSFHSPKHPPTREPYTLHHYDVRQRKFESNRGRFCFGDQPSRTTGTFAVNLLAASRMRSVVPFCKSAFGGM